ncbi:MAG: hypothetical protein ACYDHY_09920 [Acidiferrobacterales bacterium]
MNTPFDPSNFCATAAHVLTRVRDGRLSLDEADQLLMQEVPHAGPSLKRVAGWISVTTPFLDSHNDYIQVYVLPVKDDWVVLADEMGQSDTLQASRGNPDLEVSLRRVVSALLSSEPANPEPPGETAPGMPG